MKHRYILAGHRSDILHYFHARVCMSYCGIETDGKGLYSYDFFHQTTEMYNVIVFM